MYSLWYYKTQYVYKFKIVLPRMNNIKGSESQGNENVISYQSPL